MTNSYFDLDCVLSFGGQKSSYLPVVKDFVEIDFVIVVTEENKVKQYSNIVFD